MENAMHAQHILEGLLTEAIPTMHALRRDALTAAVAGTLNGATLSVTAMGRGMSGPAYEKHRIKRADQLLSNAHLHSERVGIYTALARRVLTGTPRPIISVDWSNLDEGKQAPISAEGIGCGSGALFHAVRTSASPRAVHESGCGSSFSVCTEGDCGIG